MDAEVWDALRFGRMKERPMVRTQFWIGGEAVTFDHPIVMREEEWDRLFAILELSKPGLISGDEVGDLPVAETLYGLMR